MDTVGQSSLWSSKCTAMSHAAANMLPLSKVSTTRSMPFALAYGTRQRSSLVEPELPRRMSMSQLVSIPMLPWRASIDERNVKRTSNEMSICKILCVTRSWIFQCW